MDQVDFRFRGGYPAFGFLPESMDNPHFLPDLQGINDAVGLTTMFKRQFENAGPEAFERLRNVWMSAPCNDGQGAGQVDLRPLRKGFKTLSRRLDP